MAEPIVSFVLETIGTLLIEEANFLIGVRDQAEQLYSELTRMRAFLRDADERQHDAEIVKDWVPEIRDVAYEAENVLETYVFKLASRRRRRRGTIRSYNCCILNESIMRNKFVSEIQSLNNRVSHLTRRFQTYGIRDVIDEGRCSFRQQQYQRMTYPYGADDEDFVGFREDVGRLVHALLNEGDQSFVSICGMGGLGKTTLARKVYNHPDVRHHFDSFAWICIFQQWQKRDILQSIFVSFFPGRRRDTIMNSTDGVLVERLLLFQQKRKCLVVLDDIWSTDAWDCIKYAFPIQNKGNKIMLTTRNRDVAIRIDPYGFLHMPGLLSDRESWELLQKKALSHVSSGEEYTDVERMGKEMVKFCGGLPLAVVVLGGILATKHSVGEWNVVYRNLKSNMRIEEGPVQKILALSYDDLPYQLKPCLLYLGGFPDRDIDAERLCLLWIAEGMVSTEDRIGDESMLDVAERYLDELAKRCIVHVKVFYELLSVRKFKSCGLHDLMRDLCLAKAMEERFLNVIDYQIDYMKLTDSSWGRNFHRIMIYLNAGEAQQYSVPKKEVIRTLLFSATKGGLNSRVPLPDFQFSRFKMLRSLTFEGLISPAGSRNTWQLPIGDFIHLRYLSLRYSGLVISPTSMSNLERLETLDLSFAIIKWTETVPLRMRRLRYLYITDLVEYQNNVHIHASSRLEILKGYTANKRGLISNFSELINLREVEAVLVGQANDVEKIIYDISNSRRLKCARLWTDIVHIFRPETGIEILAQLFNNSSLQYLYISGSLGKLPEYDSHFLINLLELQLIGSILEEDPMEILEKLPNLQRLWLCSGAFVGKKMVCQSRGFLQLRFLRLYYLYNLEEWTVVEGAMPNLSHLEISMCQSLAMIPQGLKFISSLKELVVEDMPEAFQDRIREVDGRKGEDFDIVCHIPSITFKLYSSPAHLSLARLFRTP